VRLYTDERSLDNCCALLSLADLPLVRPPRAPAALRAMLLVALTSVECVACEHLALMLAGPDERFGVRQALCAHVLGVFFQTLWDLEQPRGAKLRLEILAGSRGARVAAAVATGAALTAAPAYQPRRPSEVRAAVLNYLADARWLRPADVPALAAQATRRVGEHFELTRRELMDGLAAPVILPGRAFSADADARV
jgi:hypothetical protein